MFYTFRCSNHLFSVVYMYSYMYASDNGAGRRALERSCTKKRRGIFFESWRKLALKKNIFSSYASRRESEALTSELAPSAYFLGWLAGWLAGNLSLYSSTVEHNTVNIMIDVRF